MDKNLITIVNHWRIKADNDLKTAQFGMTAPEPITDTICFHCQQAAEKYLKMFLVSKGEEPKNTHNISVIIQACMQHDSSFASLEEYDFLTGYAVTLRYPDDFYIPELAETEAALQPPAR